MLFLPWPPSLDCSGFCGAGSSMRPGSLSSWAYDALETLAKKGTAAAAKKEDKKRKRTADGEEQDNTMVPPRKTQQPLSQTPSSSSASASAALASAGLALLESLRAATLPLPSSLTEEQAESLHALAAAAASSSSSSSQKTCLPLLPDAALLLVCSSPQVLSPERSSHASARALLSLVLSPVLEEGDGADEEVAGGEGKRKKQAPPLPPF